MPLAWRPARAKVPFVLDLFQGAAVKKAQWTFEAGAWALGG
jgi:hypothetical protein